MMRDRALGVSNPNTPVWRRERIEPSAVIEGVQTSQLESELEPTTSDP